MIRKYRDYCGEGEIMRNILYLLDYGYVVEMGANVMMSSDDYLHFLVVLSCFEGLVDRIRRLA